MTNMATASATATDNITKPSDSQADRIDHVEDTQPRTAILGEKNVDQFGSYTKTDPREIALVRKLDLHLMVSRPRICPACILVAQRLRGFCRPLTRDPGPQPILWSMYFLNFLDRNAIVNGKLNGLDTELGMVGSQYNTCVSIFFVG